MRHRLERKYTLPAHLAGEVEAVLRLCPASLRQAHPPRFVNSLYFDGPTRERYFQKVEGEGQRDKARIRWYGEFWGYIEAPALELKLKAGDAGTKRRWTLPAFDLSRTTHRRDLAALPIAASSGSRDLQPQRLEPVLATRYRRRYYESSEHRLRLTLDREIRYLRAPGPRGFSAPWRRGDEIVVELKYDVDREPKAQDLAQWLGLRLTGNSKFAKGLEATRY